MSNIVEFKIPVPCLQCHDCEGTTSWFALDGQIACSVCQIFLDGVRWRYEDERQTL